MKRFLFLSFAIALSAKSFAQGEIPVDLYTGTPSVVVPIATISHHDINLPLSLSYRANGIKAHQSNGVYGTGWMLSAAGHIERQVKGLPDDFAGSGSDTRKGWLYTNGASGVAQDVASFANSSDLTTSCDEATDNTKLAGWNDYVDTEPDLFIFNAGGLSGSFVFDNSAAPTIRLIPYQDISISYTTVSASDKKITSFTIRTNTGMKYTFALAIGATKIARKKINTVSIFSHEFRQYETAITYNLEWKLTRIDSPSGAFVDFSWIAVESETYTSNVTASMPNKVAGSSPLLIYTIEETIIQHYPSTITGSSTQRIAIEKTSSGFMNKIVLSDNGREPGNEGVRDFVFSYNSGFLSSIIERSHCDQKPPYLFEYVGNYDEIKNGIDAWGFNNGSGNLKQGSDLVPRIYVYPNEPLINRFRLYPIPAYVGTQFYLDGVNRLPNENFARIGALNKVTFPSGGAAVLEYESHRYLDPRTGENNLAGGLRIKKIVQYDGINASKVITKDFIYTTPNTTQSSGKLFSLPSFIIPSWKFRNPAALDDAGQELSYATISSKTIPEQYRLLMVRSADNLADQQDVYGSPVGYQHVTVKRTGEGSMLFEFKVPGSYGETSSGNWIATQDKFARTSACPSMALYSQGGEYAYPYVMNPNFDEERGLLDKKTEFNETGTAVRITENLYQYIYKGGGTPTKVWGVKYDKYANSSDIFFFGKYFLLTDYDKVLSKQTVTTYDASNTSKAGVEMQEYFFESPHHKLLSKTKSTTTEGTEYTTRYKYPLDFGAIASNSEDALLRIKEMQDPAVFMNGVVIEKTSAAKAINDTEKTISSTLGKFSNFGTTGKILPQSSLVLSIANPVSDFLEATIELADNTYKLKPDPRYEQVQAITAYTDFGRPLTSVGISNVPASTVWGYNKTLPIALVNNAGSGSFAFSDFETETPDQFTITNGYTSAARTGLKGLHPYATLSKTVTKTTATNYVLSFWVKSTADITFNITIKNTSQTSTYYNTTFSVTPDGSPAGFTYVKKVIPVASAPAIFVVTMAGQSLAAPSGSSSTLVPSLDDVVFIPESADLASSTYAIPFGASSTTDVRGATQYISYDALGRATLFYDRNKNLVSRKTYAYNHNEVAPVLVASISLPSTVYAGQSFSVFAEDNPCLTGLTYTWNFDGGNTDAVGATASHTYTLPEDLDTFTETVTLTVSGGGSTQSTSRQVKVVRPQPLSQVTVCVNGAVSYMNCIEEGTRYTNCAAYPTPAVGEGSAFYAILSSPLPGATYKWSKKYVCATGAPGSCRNEWFDLGQTGNQYLMPYNQDHHFGSFYIRCEVTSNGSVISHTLLIEVTGCE